MNEFNSHERLETILPKGNAEIIFNLTETTLFFTLNTENINPLPRCVINGVNSIPVNLIKHGHQLFLGLQLNVFVLKFLFNVPVKEFNDRVIDGSLICKSLEPLFYQIASTSAFNDQVNYILKWFNRKIAAVKHKTEITRVSRFYFDNEIITMKVNNICRKYNYSERHLRRLAVEWLGMNTEAFILYHKYLNALNLLHYANLSLTEIGFYAEYYDQSHFIREFRSFTGMTPKEYRKTMSGLPGHIYTQPLTCPNYTIL